MIVKRKRFSFFPLIKVLRYYSDFSKERSVFLKL